MKHLEDKHTAEVRQQFNELMNRTRRTPFDTEEISGTSNTYELIGSIIFISSFLALAYLFCFLTVGK